MKNETEMESPEVVVDAQAADRETVGEAGNDVTAEMSWSPGGLVRRAREARNLPLEALSVQTKLSVRILRALEVDDFDALSEPVYVRGYYRRCAHALGIPSGEVVKAYERASGEPPPQPMPLKPTVGEEDLRSPPRWLPYVVLAVVAGALIALIVWWGQPVVTRNLLGTSDTGSVSNASAVDGGDAALSAAPAADKALPAAPVTTAMDETTPVATLTTAARTTATAPSAPPADDSAALVDAVAVPAPAAAAAPAQPAAVPVPVAAEADTLTVNFAQKSWVRITDADGNRLLNGLIPGGTRRELNGKPPFDVLLGYAPGVDLSYDGKAVSLNDYIQSNNTAHLTVGGS